jgi:hypothetical protein
MILLNGCSTTEVVSSPAPRPYFPSCSTIYDLAKPDRAESSTKDWVRVVNIMIKLNSLLPKKEMVNVVTCSNPIEHIYFKPKLSK